MAFIVYYMQREIRSIFKHRLAYFRDFWSYPELGIIACSWAGLGVYVWRIHEGNRVGDIFKKTDGYAYVNLQLAAYVHDVLTFLLGFCCFFGTIKFLRLLRFNHRMSLLSSTLAYAAKDLLSFTCMFSVIYLGYLALFFLLFHSKIWACSDAVKTAQMLFEMMLLKFDVSDLYAADVFLGPFCFTMFIIFVVFICMNMVRAERPNEQKNSDASMFSSFPSLPIRSASFDTTLTCSTASTRSWVSCSINSRSGQVKRGTDVTILRHICGRLFRFGQNTGDGSAAFESLRWFTGAISRSDYIIPR